MSALCAVLRDLLREVAHACLDYADSAKKCVKLLRLMTLLEEVGQEALMGAAQREYEKLTSEKNESEET